MYTDRRTVSLATALSLALAALPLSAFALPTGDVYDYQVTNFPLTGTAPLTFDGLPENVGGQTVIEIAFAYGGGGAGAYAAPGEAIEFDIETQDGLAFVDPRAGAHNPGGASRIFISGLAKDDPNDVVRADSLFLYFTNNTQILPFGATTPPQGFYAPYPHSGFFSVWFPTNNSFDAQFMGFATDAIAGINSLSDLLTALGIAPEGVNDMHFGYLVDRVPEPSVASLLALGLLALMSSRRRA